MKFSVLLPVYHADCPQKFSLAIDSIINNSVMPNQIVVVVDGPIPTLLNNVIDSLDLPIFKIIRLNVNSGIIKALNEGLLHCTHEIVARCDADDINLLDRFEIQLEAFKRDADLVMCGGHIKEIGDGKAFHRFVPVCQSHISKVLKFRNPFNHMSVMFKKSYIIGVGSYPNVKYREDYALWALLYSYNYKIFNLDHVLVHASGGSSMYKRRGSFKDIPYEIKLQKFLLKLGVINYKQFTFNLLIRLSNMIVGPYIRGIIYKLFLRSKVSEV